MLRDSYTSHKRALWTAEARQITPQRILALLVDLGVPVGNGNLQKELSAIKKNADCYL